MSARSQQFATDSDEGFSLVPALRDCLSPGIIAVNRQKQIVSCTPEAERMFALPPGAAANAALSILPAAIQNVFHEILRPSQDTHRLRAHHRHRPATRT
jgi:nitrogen fixation/metabolism regulation signal transduction histidine kinase